MREFCIPEVGIRGVGGEDDGTVGDPALLASVGLLEGLARRALSLLLLLALPGICSSSTGLGLVGLVSWQRQKKGKLGPSWPGGHEFFSEKEKVCPDSFNVFGALGIF